MDITALFNSCVEAIRQQNKELSFMVPPDKAGIKGSSSSASKPKIFPGKKSEYYSQARELSKTITSLRDYLQENRNAYLNITASAGHHHNSVFSASGERTANMKDTERDMMDNDVQKIIHNCQRRILDYEQLIETTESIQNNPNLRTHMESVAESLSAYLKQVTTLFSEMRAVRVKRTVDYQNMSRLSSVNKTDKLRCDSSSNKALSSSSSNRRTSAVEAEEIDGRKTGSKSSNTTIPDYFLEDNEIPPEELQLLEEENAALLNQLNSLAQEVDQIQSNVVQIAQLQEIFTEKVLQQEKEIEQIANVVVGATENIKGGNEQIRQAIQKNADFRVWVLFFILVMSFSLLFLDWYND